MSVLSIRVIQLLLLVILPGQLLADFQQHAFAKPFSGEKVHSYIVELAVKKANKQKFDIPTDCNSVLDYVNRGADSWASSVERQLWFKVINDCRYVSYLYTNPKPAANDFVSQYDFYSTRLEDWPFASECKSEQPTVTMEDCPPFPPGILNLSTFFPFLEIKVNEEPVDTFPCKFTNGMFRGRLIRSKENISCVPDRRAPGLRLMSVDFTDLNADGYQDALLRILPLGRGISRMPILLPLTRKSHDEKFSIPNGTYLDKF